jgi:hypothetical protein
LGRIISCGGVMSILDTTATVLSTFTKCIAGITFLLIFIWTIKELGINAGGWFGGGIASGALVAFILLFPIFYIDFVEPSMLEYVPSKYYLLILIIVSIIGFSIFGISIMIDLLRKKSLIYIKKYLLLLAMIIISLFLSASAIDTTIILFSHRNIIVGIVGLLYALVYFIIPWGYYYYFVYGID